MSHHTIELYFSSYLKAFSTTITQAFRRLHDAGVLHGDIRTHNLLLDPSGAFYIIDFDQAEVDPDESEYEFKAEMRELTALLYVEEDEDGGDNDEGVDEDECEDVELELRSNSRLEFSLEKLECD